MIEITAEELAADRFHDECGVFAISGHAEASRLTYLGLYGLQHRGQESAGSVSSDGKRLFQYRGMGYVADIFSDEALRRLPGNASIGHVRYSTTGESRLANARPAPISSPCWRLLPAAGGAVSTSARRATRKMRLDFPPFPAIIQTSNAPVVELAYTAG